MDQTLQMYIDKLNKLNFQEMYEGDFFLTWEKSDDELEAVFTVADALRSICLLYTSSKNPWACCSPGPPPT